MELKDAQARANDLRAAGYKARLISVDTRDDGDERIVSGVICNEYDVLVVMEDGLPVIEAHKIVGTDPRDLIELAKGFMTQFNGEPSISQAVSALNYAAAYGEYGVDVMGLFE